MQVKNTTPLGDPSTIQKNTFSIVSFGEKGKFYYEHYPLYSSFVLHALLNW